MKLPIHSNSVANYIDSNINILSVTWNYEGIKSIEQRINEDYPQPSAEVARELIARTLLLVANDLEASNAPFRMQALEDVYSRLNFLDDKDFKLTKWVVKGDLESVQRFVSSLPPNNGPELVNFVSNTGYYEINEKALTEDQRILQREADIRDRGEETNWHPLGGTATWYDNDMDSGFLLKIWFDSVSKKHYKSSFDAYEIQIIIPSSCMTTNFVATIGNSNLDDGPGCEYEDTRLGDNPFDGNLNLGRGTQNASGLHEDFLYWIWLPVRRQTIGCSDSDFADVTVLVQSQPSITNLNGVAREPCDRTNLHIFSRTFDGDGFFTAPYNAYTDIEEDNIKSVLGYKFGRIQSGVEIAWARNLCALTNGALWSGGVSPQCDNPDNNPSDCSFGRCINGKCAQARAPHNGELFQIRQEVNADRIYVAYGNSRHHIVNRECFNSYAGPDSWDDVACLTSNGGGASLKDMLSVCTEGSFVKLPNSATVYRRENGKYRALCGDWTPEMFQLLYGYSLSDAALEVSEEFLNETGIWHNDGIWPLNSGPLGCSNDDDNCSLHVDETGLCFSSYFCSSIETKQCGECGIQHRSCDNGQWSAWSICQDEGICAPGTEQACGQEGTQICQNDCNWGSCENQSCIGLDEKQCGNCGTQYR
ncbi:hypothetical protein KKF91_05130, partial [Myxococcota bacterium]|nr:hypothetical protein [Myxococcota bacterium]